MRGGSRQAEEDWDYVLGGLGVDRSRRMQTKADRKRDKKRRKRGKKLMNDEGAEWDGVYDDEYYFENSDLSDSDSDENDMSSVSSEESVSVDDPDEAKKIDRRFHELFGDQKPLLNLADESVNVSGLASSLETVD